jgi:hypothetical protein
MSNSNHDDPMKQVSDALKGPDRPDGPGEEICEKCGRKITKDPANGLEYGHERAARHSDRSDCPRRPQEVEPGNLKLKDGEARS